MGYRFELALIVEERCPSTNLKEIKDFPDKIGVGYTKRISIPRTLIVEDEKCALATVRLVNAPSFIKLDVLTGLVILQPSLESHAGGYTFDIE